MAIQFNKGDLGEVDFESCDASGFPVAGRTLAKLISVDTGDGGNNGFPYEELTFQVLRHEKPGQDGKRFRERIYHYGADDHKTKKCRDRAVGIAKRMGIYTDEDREQDADIEYDQAIGDTFVVDLEESKPRDGDPNGKTYVNMGFMGIYNPRSAETLAKYPSVKEFATWARAGKGEAPSAKSPAKTDAGSNGKDDGKGNRVTDKKTNAGKTSGRRASQATEV